MADYASNSQNKQPAEEPAPSKVEKVVEGKVVERKKSVGRRLADNFTGQSGKSVGEYIFWDLIVPQVKDLIFDVISGGAQKVLFGDGPAGRSWRPGASKGGYTSYSSMSTSSALSKAAANVRPAVVPSDTFGEIILETRPEAEAVMEKISNTIDQYGKASVGDLKAAVGLTGNMTDENFGWIGMGGTSIRRVGGSQPGFALIFPDPEPL